MSKPVLRVYKDETTGAAIAELAISDGGKTEMYSAAMQPGELAVVRKRVEDMARAHNVKLSGWIAGTDADAPMESSKALPTAADPDELMAPSLAKKTASKKYKMFVGTPVLTRSSNGVFKKLLSLSSTMGSAAVFTPSSGGNLHCIRLPDGRIMPTRVFHCANSAQLAGSLSDKDLMPMKVADVDKIIDAQVRGALVGRVIAQIPPRKLRRAAALELKARGFSNIGVTGFNSPSERFVDDAFREEQMLRAMKDGTHTLDDELHDGVFGEAIEDGVFDGLKPYSRGEIVEPDEVMNPPEDLLESQTVLEESYTTPKSTLISSTTGISGYVTGADEQDQIEEFEDRLPHHGNVGWSLKNLVKKTGSGMLNAGKVAASYRLAPVKALARAAKKLNQFVPGRDNKKKALTQQTYTQATDKIAKGRAWRRGSRTPNAAETTAAKLIARKLMAKHGLPTDILGWTTAGLREIPMSANSGDWISGLVSLRKAVTDDQYKKITALRGVSPDVARLLGEDLTIRRAIDADISGIAATKRRPNTSLVGAWWNPFSWFQHSAKAVLTEADLLAQSPDDLPELPPGAEGADAASASPGDGSPGDGSPSDGSPSEAQSAQASSPQYAQRESASAESNYEQENPQEYAE